MTIRRAAPPTFADGRIPTAPALLGLVLVAIATAAVAVGCTRRSAATPQATDVQVEMVELLPDPPAVGQAFLVIRLTDPHGMALSGASVQLKADMTHAGMTPVFGEAVEQADGRYRTRFEWSMAGDWILTVSGTLEDGRTFRRELPVSVASGGGATGP